MTESATVVTDEALSGAVHEILSGADLSTLSSKQVRQALERRFGLCLSQRREEIDNILMRTISDRIANGERFEGLEVDNAAQPLDGDRLDENGRIKKSQTSLPQKLGPEFITESNSSCDDDDDDGGSVNEEDDEELARRLQLEELGVRKRNVDRRPARPKRPVKGDDSNSTPARKKRNSAYTQECVLSPELTAIMGTDRLARKDVVSRMWKIFKERNLMDPRNKQYVLCDEQLERIFKTKKFRAFGMMKILKHHIKDARLVQK